MLVVGIFCVTQLSPVFAANQIKPTQLYSPTRFCNNSILVMA